MQLIWEVTDNDGFEVSNSISKDGLLQIIDIIHPTSFYIC